MNIVLLEEPEKVPVTTIRLNTTFTDNEKAFKYWKMNLERFMKPEGIAHMKATFRYFVEKKRSLIEILTFKSKYELREYETQFYVGPILVGKHTPAVDRDIEASHILLQLSPSEVKPFFDLNPRNYFKDSHSNLAINLDFENSSALYLKPTELTSITVYE